VHGVSAQPRSPSAADAVSDRVSSGASPPERIGVANKGAIDKAQWRRRIVGKGSRRSR